MLGSGLGMTETDLLGRLTTALERMSLGQERQVTQFKTPTFDGQGDVELFIQQFLEVSVANRWEETATLLHLRETLKEGARDCGRPRTLEGIFVALRARYGFSPREARARLGALKRDQQTTLQEHASEVQRLVGIAYPDLPLPHQVDMIIDTFCSTIGNAYLQRHLLAVPTRTLEEAVQAGNEFLQIKLYPARASVRTVEDTGEGGDAEPEVSQVDSPPKKSPMEEALEPVLRMVQQLADQVQQLQSVSGPVTELTQPVSYQELVCWNCGGAGHMQQQCPSWLGSQRGFNNQPSVSEFLSGDFNSSGNRLQQGNRRLLSGDFKSPGNRLQQGGGQFLSGGRTGPKNRWQQGNGQKQSMSGSRDGFSNRQFPSGGRTGPKNRSKQGNGPSLQ
jgi:hypothetical protein